MASLLTLNASYQCAIGVINFNLKRHQFARGSHLTPYPQARDVYVQSSLVNPKDDFSNLYMNNLVHVGKHIACKKLRTLETTKFLLVLLACGSVVQVHDSLMISVADLHP